jgi:hypothetical protein
MDLCADLMSSHMELNGRGLNSFMSRRDRLALMKSGMKHRGGGGGGDDGGDGDGDEAGHGDHFSRHGSINSINPMAGVEIEMSPSSGSAAGAPGEGGGGDSDEPGFVPVLWFICAMALMASWTAMMTFLGVFKAATKDSNIFLKMNAAYYGPALPVLILNMTYGKKMDACLGSYRGYMLRGVFCLALLGVIMMIHPLLKQFGATWILIESFLIGLVGGMSYGCVFSFNSLFSKTSAATFCMGLFAPGFVFMAFQLGTDFSANPKRKVGATPLVDVHWYLAGALTFVGVIGLVLLLNLPASRQLLVDADKKLAEEAAAERSGVAAKAGKGKKPDGETSMKEVAGMIYIAIISIFASIFAIVAITTYFTKVPGSGNVVDVKSLPVMLFYVKNSADFLGRVFTLLPLCIKTQKVLGVVVFLRFLLVPVFFMYAMNVFPADDVLILVLVGVSGVTSGYINTSCFVVAGGYMKTPDAKKAGSALMNLSLQGALVASISFGAIMSFAVDGPALPAGAAVNGTVVNGTAA